MKNASTESSASTEPHDGKILIDLPSPKGDLWVFGYGSLMWQPGFSFQESSTAKIFGYHRALCIRSTRYRGTPRTPGLVFGLDRGGSCLGLAFRVKFSDRLDVLEYLELREMLHNVYIPSFKKISLADGRRVEALTFIVQRQHPRYTRSLTPDETATIILNATGERGPNLEYVQASMEKLASIGIQDQALNRVCKLALKKY